MKTMEGKRNEWTTEKTNKCKQHVNKGIESNKSVPFKHRIQQAG